MSEPLYFEIITPIDKKRDRMREAESLRRFYPREVTPHYINFYFNALDYDDQYYSGAFYAPDNDIYCEFKYDRITGECCLYKENRPKEEILPLPIWWLDKKLEENGKLDSSESRICY